VAWKTPSCEHWLGIYCIQFSGSTFHLFDLKKKNIVVDRVLSFLSSRPNWDSPPPSHAGECVVYLSPPLVPGEGTLACGRGGTDTVVLLVYMYFVSQSNDWFHINVIISPLYLVDPLSSVMFDEDRELQKWETPGLRERGIFGMVGKQSLPGKRYESF
jgi:hypothetical protein